MTLTSRKKSFRKLCFSAFAGVALLTGCSAGPATEIANSPVAATAPAQIVQLPVQKRMLALSVYRPATEPLAVLLMSHGGGNPPEGMRTLTDRLTADGFIVLAPIHTDSREAPAEVQTALLPALFTRVEDVKVMWA